MALAGAAALLVLVTTWRVARVTAQLKAATAELRRVDPDLRAGNLEAAIADLSRADARLTSANEIARTSPDLAVARLVPVARQNIDAVRDSVAVALRLVTGGRRILQDARPLRNDRGKFGLSLNGGQVPLDTIKALDLEIGDIAFDLPGKGEQRGSRLLVGRVSQLRQRVYQEAARRRSQLSSAARGLDLLTELAGGNGPRRYLLAVANIAEMRGSGGMILSYGVLTSNDGRFRLDRFGPIDDLKLDGPAPAQAPADVMARLAALGPNREWRNANLPLDFRSVGPVLESMFTKATGLPLDGVIQIDSVGLSAILRGTGPIDVGGLGTVDADNVVPLTLNQAYTSFPSRPVRQDYLASVARTAFERLVGGEFASLTPLADALRSAVAGRHVLLHAVGSEAERVTTALGADGGVPPQDADWGGLTVQNFSANKLDYYLDTSLLLRGRRPPGRIGEVTAEVTLSNTAPVNGRPPYVFGPFNPSLKAGDYRGLATLYVPSGTFIKSSLGTDPGSPATVTTENGQTVVVFTATVPAGASKTISLDMLIPPGPPSANRFQLVSTPRVRPTTVTVSIDEGSAVLRMDGPLAETMVLEPGRARPAGIVNG